MGLRSAARCPSTSPHHGAEAPSKSRGIRESAVEVRRMSQVIVLDRVEDSM